MFLFFSCWAATFWTSWSHSNQNPIKIPGGRHFSDSKPIYCQRFFSPFIFCARNFKSIMTWEGERGHRDWTCAHQSGQYPPATWTRTERQGLFPTLNSAPSSLEGFLLFRDIKQLINFSFPLNNLQKALGSHLGSVLLYRKKQGYAATLSCVYYSWLLYSQPCHLMVCEGSMNFFFHSITSLFNSKPDYCIHLIKLFCCKYCFSYCNNIFSLSWNFIFSQKLIPEMYLRLMRIEKAISFSSTSVSALWFPLVSTSTATCNTHGDTWVGWSTYIVLPTRTYQSSSSFTPSRSFVFSSWGFFLQIFAVTWARLSQPSSLELSTNPCPQVSHLHEVFPHVQAWGPYHDPAWDGVNPSVKNFLLILNLSLPWYNLKPFHLILSFTIWEKRSTLSWLQLSIK